LSRIFVHVRLPGVGSLCPKQEALMHIVVLPWRLNKNFQKQIFEQSNPRFDYYRKKPDYVQGF
jgi:hypothetical protein